MPLEAGYVLWCPVTLFSLPTVYLAAGSVRNSADGHYCGFDQRGGAVIATTGGQSCIVHCVSRRGESEARRDLNEGQRFVSRIARCLACLPVCAIWALVLTSNAVPGAVG